MGIQSNDKEEKEMGKKKMTWLYAAMLGTLILSFSMAVVDLGAQPKSAAAPFKIGIVTSLTGPGYAWAQRSLIGIRYRVEEEINKAGGINGHPVQLIMFDTTTKADQAVMLTERAATVDKVFAILGPNSSSDVMAGFPTANRLAVPDITMGGTLRGLCEKNAPWCFATMGSDDFGVEPLVLLKEKYNLKTMVIMKDAKYNFSLSQADWGYKLVEREGLKVVHEKGKLDVETGWADFTPQVTQIKALAPDVIFSPLFPPDIAHFAVALKGAGIDPKKTVCFGTINVTPDMIVGAGAAAEGWYGSSDYDFDSKDPVQQAWEKKLTDYGKTITSDPGIYTITTNTACAYDAAAFLCEAIKRTKITPETPLQEARTKIRDELLKIRMKTFTSQEFYFGQGGRYEKNRMARPMTLIQVKDGKLISVGQVTK